MKRLTYLGLVAGLTLLVFLLAWRGIGDVARILASSGWALLLLPPAWLPVFLMFTRSWQVLFVPADRPPFHLVFAAVWIGRAVNNLLPVAQLGGEFVRARVLTLWGARAAVAAASVIVDKTVHAAAAASFGFLGVVLLLALAPDSALAWPVAAGLALICAGVVGFVLVQRAGLFGFAARLAGTFGKEGFESNLAGRAADTDNEIRDTYTRFGALAGAYLWRFGGLLVQSGEIWLAAHLLGHPIGFVEAVMLKSLSTAISDVAFMIPNSYGVQEGAYVVLGGMLSLPPDFMLALSLATRLREFAFDLPGLVLWQYAEGRRVMRIRARETG